MLEKERLKILGKSSEANRIRKAIKYTADRTENVLLLGTVGCGRTTIAKSIHRLSWRRDELFIDIQCGAIGDTIKVEHVFGDFANEPINAKGQLFSAGKGTIYLDGINRLNTELQNRLYNFITVIKEKPNNNIIPPFESRIIASGEPSLEKKIREGTFRLDLFQAIDKFRINVPSIRARKQDIPFLFTHFLEEFCYDFGKPIPTVPYDIFEAIIEYDWPGNIAELRNCVRNLVIMSPEGKLSPEYLPFRAQPHPLEVLASKDLISAVSEVERFLIRKALARYEGNQSKAARLLQVSEAALRYKMKNMDCNRQDNNKEGNSI